MLVPFASTRESIYGSDSVLSEDTFLAQTHLCGEAAWQARARDSLRLQIEEQHE
jgi:hypothetical protein